THEYRRHGGSIGTNMTPGRVKKGMKMPGQHGNKTRSVLSQKIVKVVAEQNLILVHGGVPGSRNGLVFVRGAVKKRGGLPKA
ncbi:MAG: 50S ribosomal protein L3, partial [Polyangiaceae bacterium]